MTILLDTNACIAVINGHPPSVRQRVRDAVDSGQTIAASSITLFELWYGVANSAQVARNAEQLVAFLANVVILPFDAEDARTAGGIRADLRRVGKPIGTYDLLIAGCAVRRGLLLITANVGEFSRVKGLRWEDWSV